MTRRNGPRRTLRWSAAVCVTALLVTSCGDDDEGGSDTTAAESEESSASTPASSVGTPTTASTPTTAATSAPDSTTAGDAETASPEAQAALLTPDDLQGWSVVPDDDDEDPEFSAPECAAVQALDDDPAMQNEANIDLVSPDGGTRVTHSVVIGEPEVVDRAFAVVADPNFPACLNAAFTGLLSRPGQLPDGVTLAGVEFASEPLQAGDAAAGHAGTVTLTGPDGTTQTVNVRMDAVRAGDAAGLLITLASPGAAPIDPTEIAVAAATRMAAAAG